MNALEQEIRAAIAAGSFDPLMTETFLTRLDEGAPTRAESPASHFSTYFLPHDAATHRVFLVAHKKSGLWISPGGHIERGETLQQTLNRELREELGLPAFFGPRPQPFLLTSVEIFPPDPRPCRRHYDLWFLLPTDGRDFRVNPTEFNDTRWLTKTEALRLVSDETNIQAINLILK